MRFAIYAALLLALMGPWLLTAAALRLQPKTAAVTVTAGVAICAVTWLLGLSTLTVVTIGRLESVAEVGGWSARSLAADSPVPVAAGIVAGLLLCAAVAGMALAAGRMAHGLVQLRRLRAATGRPDRDRCIVVQSAVPEAITVPGWRGAVLITSGMLDALEPHEHPVLLAHEQCHLRSRHWLFQLGARLAAAALPTGRSVPAICNQALERWADEVAAAEVGDRTVAARAVAKAALASTGYRSHGLAAGMADGVVLTRVEALLRPRTRTCRTWLAVAAGGLALTSLAAGEALRDAEALLHLARTTLG